MALLDDVKTTLRITNTAYDGEVTDLINAAKADLILSGVETEKVEDETDTLIKRAISTYVKSNFGWGNLDSDKLQQSYERLKQHLALSTEYAKTEVE